MRDYKNQRINKKNLAGKNTNTCRAITSPFWRLVTSLYTGKMCQKILSVWKMNKSVIVLRIYLCAFGAFQQKKLISLRQNPINRDQKHFAAAYWKRKEKNAIVNKNILNKWKDLFFVLFCFVFFKESRLGSLSVYLWISISRSIYTMSIEQKSFQFIEKYCLKKMKKTSISKLLVYIQNNKNIVIHCSSHCSYRNCSYTTWTECLCSLSSSFSVPCYFVSFFSLKN